MSRKGRPESDRLWDELPAEDVGARRSAKSVAKNAAKSVARSDPPDWALPSWDAIDDADAGAVSRPGELAEAAESAQADDSAEPAEPRAPPGRAGAASSTPRTSPPVSPEQVTPAPSAPEFALRILGVSEVTRAVRDAVRADTDLRDIWVEGEVGRVTVSSAGHCYFTLKDERSQLACVFFRDDRLASPFEARTGLRVVVHGRVDVFEAQGVYQLYVSAVQPAGFGDLALKFEALKADRKSVV